jgi:hypothetical protein
MNIKERRALMDRERQFMAAMRGMPAPFVARAYRPFGGANFTGCGKGVMAQDWSQLGHKRVTLEKLLELAKADKDDFDARKAPR